MVFWSKEEKSHPGSFTKRELIAQDKLQLAEHWREGIQESLQVQGATQESRVPRGASEAPHLGRTHFQEVKNIFMYNLPKLKASSG